MFPVGAIFVPFPPKTGKKMLHSRPPPIIERVPVSVHVHRTEGVTGSKGREETNRLGNIIEVGGGNGDGNTDGGRNRDVNGDGDGAGTRTAV